MRQCYSLPMQRFTDDDVKTWRREGFAILPGFFSGRELAPLLRDFKRLYGTSGDGDGKAMVAGIPEDEGSFTEMRERQFRNIDTLPFAGGVELDLISLHPALIGFAKALLGVPEVRLYQCHTWAKYTGETDYEQDFHCDFGNHTLLVPSDELAQRTVDFIFYITDVTDGHGALHYVPRSECESILGPGRVGAADPERQAALREAELSAAGPAGTLVAHSIDTFHRGTNLTVEKGYRFSMTAGYKAAGNDMIGFHVWQQNRGRDFSTILSHGTPEQLACLGIPLPGDAYWTLRTLKLTSARWPDWDMTLWFEALKP